MGVNLKTQHLTIKIISVVAFLTDTRKDLFVGARSLPTLSVQTKLPILMSFHVLSALYWGWEGKKDRLDGYSWIKCFSHPGTLLFAALLNGCPCQWVHSEGKLSLQAWRLGGRGALA